MRLWFPGATPPDLRAALVHALIAGAALLVSCGLEDESGACPGFMDGSYFRLQVINTGLDAGEVRVNGRFIGRVPGAESLDNADTERRYGTKSLGIFPMCERMAIETSGGRNAGSTKVCMTSVMFSPECRAHRQSQDYCWLSFLYFAENNPPPDPDLLSRFQSPGCDLSGPCNGALYETAASNDCE